MSKHVKEEFVKVTVKMPRALHAEVKIHCVRAGVDINEWMKSLAKKALNIK